jgi:vancomycin resistance protein YoaR
MSTSSSTKKGIKWQTIILGALAFVAICLVIAIGGTYGAYVKWRESGKIAPHYMVQGEDIGGLTLPVAKERLQTRFGRLFVTLHAPDRDFKLSLSQLGGNLQYDYAVEQARRYGRKGNTLVNLWQFGFSASQEKREVLPLRWDEKQLRKTLWTVAHIYQQKPQDAHLEVKNGAVQVVSEQLGRSLNLSEVIKTIQQKYFPGLPAVKIPAQTEKPKVLAAALQGQDVLLGKYTTRFNPGEEGRTTNVRLAAKAVDGQVLMPGATFSLNHTTGERTPAKGYQVAKIFVKLPDEEKSQIVDGVGGGVCQVSSTLFNAVRRTNDKSNGRLKIVERNHHSLPVHYVPPGLDATVAWPYKDFRFRNDYSFPIYVRTEINGSHLTISLWGRIPDATAAPYSAALHQENDNEDNG